MAGAGAPLANSFRNELNGPCHGYRGRQAMDEHAPSITTVAAYLADQPPASRRALRLVRTAICSALPGAEEC